MSSVSQATRATGKAITFQDGADAGAVSVTVEWAEARNYARIPVRYVVTGWIPGTSKAPYRATVRACGRDDCRLGTVAPCARPLNQKTGRHAAHKEAEGRKHNRTHCHGWHDGTVEALARRILATYGTGVA